MSPVRPRRTAAIAVSATALLVLTGCGTGFSAQTNQPYDAAVGSNQRGGNVDVLNALFVDNGDGTATFSAAFLNKDKTSHILKSVTATTDAGAPIASTLAAPRELEPQTLFSPGKAGDIILTGEFPTGGFVRITFDIEGVAPITVDAPVVTRTTMYDSVARIAEVPTPAARTAAGAGLIKITNARLVLGASGKAFLGATVTSTAKDNDYAIPTATDSDGASIELKHQTATGGPADIVAAAGESRQIGVVGNTAGDDGDDGYYVEGVKIGDKMILSFPFKSGTVTVTATVVTAE